jgi:branched-chain amino acid aminotransferase
MSIYYVNGEFVEAEKAVIPVDDLAVLRGYGVFDLMRTFDGIPFCLHEHIERLQCSAEKIGLLLPWTHDKIAAVVKETLRKNQHAESNIRIVVTGGSSPDFITPQGNPRLLVMVTPLPKLPDAWYKSGVKVITVLSERQVPEAKSIDYIPATIGLQRAKEEGAIEAVYVDRKGNVLEGTTSNIFAIRNRRLISPDKGILSGITRRVILRLAKNRLAVELRDMTLDELISADEVFITGTNKGVVPVVQVGRHRIGDGDPGPHTRQLMNDFIDFVHRSSQ